MPDWTAISKEALLKRVAQGVARMSPGQLRLWNAVRIEPQKWAQEPYGREGNGFWVVAVLGQTVIWYNDLEDGFNRSRYSSFGTIEDYWCNHDELEVTMAYLMAAVERGLDLVVMRKPVSKVAP
jgi:hypothetical protein